MNMREPPFLPLQPSRPIELSGRRVLVLGLGDTGVSVARWAAHCGALVRVADTRSAPPGAAALAAQAPAAQVVTGAFDAALLEAVDLVCISPGLALEQPLVREAQLRGLPVVGDIELFAWQLRRAPAAQPTIAITGTNGKTTVTALTGHLMRSAGVDAEVAGNIGPAVLAALLAREAAARPAPLWVLELSSYQLETTFALEAEIASILNLADDHLDRYPSRAAYAAAKARIYAGAGIAVINRDDPASASLVPAHRRALRFGLDRPGAAEDFGIDTVDGAAWLVRGATPILAAAALRIHGRHNLANALAAAALASAAGAPLEAIARGLASFEGLPHRLQRVAVRRNVAWFDDSKATNVGATLAALEGLAMPLVLIAGGDGKGQDFTPLAAAVARRTRRVLLIGRDAPVIERALAGAGVALEHCGSLDAAVAAAARCAAPGDAVLLSPACASFDMFRDYRDRGEQFARAVRALGD